jgi:uncharacterized RDD family membrane protein YckC
VGYSLSRTGAAPVGGAFAVPGQAPVAYAGFWLRLVAAIIDGILLGIPLVPIWFAVFASVIPSLGTHLDPSLILTTLLPKFLFIVFIGLVASWLYWGLMESSSWQATLGKKALGLMVTDLEGRRASFARTSGRYCAGRLASAVPWLGGLYYLISCICAGFTEKKQAIHDMIAGCLVIRKV